MPSPTRGQLLEAAALLRDNTLSPTEFAAKNGVSYQTILRRVRRGELDAVFVGRDVRVLLAGELR